MAGVYPFSTLYAAFGRQNGAGSNRLMREIPMKQWSMRHCCLKLRAYPISALSVSVCLSRWKVSNLLMSYAISRFVPIRLARYHLELRAAALFVLTS